MSTRCERSVELATLLDYRLGALGADEAAFEEHLFGCGDCARRLALVATLGDAVARLAAGGRVVAGVTAEHLDRLARDGLQLRSYRIAPGGSVHCTIAPDDDVSVVRLGGDFAGVEAVDLALEVRAGEQVVQRDTRDGLVIDRAAGEAVLLFPGEQIRAYGELTFELSLSEAGSGRALGRYTMHHTPWTE